MQEPFDPYRAWLGFEPGRQPSDHYQLLGIPAFESDPAVIGRAADGLLSQIRSVRPGEHLAQWQQLLDHLRSVKACLLNPAAKAAYDAMLRGFPSDASTSEPPPNSASPEVHPRARLRSYWPRTLLCAGCLAAALVAAVLAFHLLRQRPDVATPPPDAAAGRPSDLTVPAAGPVSRKATESLESVVDKPPAQPGAPAAARPNPVAPSEPTPSVEPGPPPKPALEKPPADPDQPPAQAERTAAPPIDPAKQAAFGRETAAARAALAEHDLTTARRHLAAAAAAAQTAEEKGQASRLETLLTYLDEFWKAVRQSAAALHTGQELAIGKTIILVVEASADGVVLRAEGRNYTYPIHQIPHSVAVKLAETWLADVPSSKVLLASYLMVDPKGDRARARQLLEEAARAGINVSDLLVELGVAPAASGSPTSAPASAASPTLTGKTAVPTDEARIQKAAAETREIFRSEYAQANTPAGKARLAAKLLEGAATVADDPVTRYVMLREARDMAVAAGDPALACGAVDQLAALFDVDPLVIKLAVLESLAKGVRGLEGQRKIAETALELIPEAVKAGRVEEAGKLAETAEAAAVKAKSVPLVRAARAAIEKLQSPGR